MQLEVLPKKADISRMQSKVNLNVIIENNSRRKNNNSLFDKLWYQKREESKLKLNNGVKVGFVFDG